MPCHSRFRSIGGKVNTSCRLLQLTKHSCSHEGCFPRPILPVRDHACLPEESDCCRWVGVSSYRLHMTYAARSVAGRGVAWRVYRYPCTVAAAAGLKKETRLLIVLPSVTYDGSRCCSRYGSRHCIRYFIVGVAVGIAEGSGEGVAIYQVDRSRCCCRCCSSNCRY